MFHDILYLICWGNKSRVLQGSRLWNDLSFTLIGILVLIYGLLASVRMVHAAGKLHDSLLVNILRCPMSFFDTTPIGRIINRFSSDMDGMDTRLPLTFRICLNSLYLAGSTIIVISINTPIFLTVVVSVGVLYFIIMVCIQRATRITCKNMVYLSLLSFH